MVVMLSGLDGGRAAEVGAALARETGWRLVNGSDHDAASLHALAAAALDRRERLIVECRALDAGERDAVRGDLRTVRFVVSNHATDPGAVAIDPSQTALETVSRIRRELGL
ncbi:MAG: hypothetical protein ACHQO8_05100 [Vicinamibacterales bacterium]